MQTHIDSPCPRCSVLPHKRIRPCSIMSQCSHIHLALMAEVPKFTLKVMWDGSSLNCSLQCGSFGWGHWHQLLQLMLIVFLEHVHDTKIPVKSRSTTRAHDQCMGNAVWHSFACPPTAAPHIHKAIPTCPHSHPCHATSQGAHDHEHH